MKVPPQDIKIESAILGALLLESECQVSIERLTPDMFYDPKHIEVFKAMKELHSKRDSVDLLTVTSKCNGKVDALFITQLMTNVVSSLHISEHIGILLQKYIQRKILRFSMELTEKQYDNQDIAESISSLNTLLEECNNIISTGTEIKSYADLIDESLEIVMTKIDNRQKGIRPGVPIPFKKLQDTIGGWQNEDLVYIAARPGMGKTAVSIVLAREAAMSGKKVLFFSLEMSDVAITDRAILGETEIDPDSWKLGKVGDYELEQVGNIKNEREETGLYIIDKSSITTSEVATICRKEKPDIIFIDYVQLMKPGRLLGNRNLELGEISHDLKGIAKEFKIPVIAMAQLSRKVEERGDKKPILSDLRDSGELEQDADIVIMLYREGMYNADPNNIIELNLCKHRNGRTGKIAISHNQYMNKFADVKEESTNPF